MSRSFGFLGIGAVLLAAGVALLLGCGSGCSVRDLAPYWNGTSVNGVSLPYEATLTARSDAKPSRFRLTLESASIRVEGDVTVTGIAAEFDVNERTPGDVSIAVADDTVTATSASGSPFLVRAARIRVPPGTPVEVKTEFGAVRVAGIRDAASVSAVTENGRVELADLANVPSVTGRSEFGRVSLDRGTNLAVVSLRTENGAVAITSLAGATTVTGKTEFGGIDATDVGASESLTLTTSNGSVEAERVNTPRAKLGSDFGGIRAKDSTFGHVEARTSNGGVRLTHCTYTTKDLHTDFGSVREGE